MIYHDGRTDLQGLEVAVERTSAHLKLIRLQYDAIVVTGLSGVIVGSPVSLNVGMPLCILRKGSDDCHTDSLWVNRPQEGDRLIFLDDFICGGHTRNRIRDAVENRGARLVGQYLYRDHQLHLYRDEPRWKPRKTFKPPSSPLLDFDVYRQQYPASFTDVLQDSVIIDQLAAEKVGLTPLPDIFG